MHIMQVNTKYSGGGAANIAYSLHNYINKDTDYKSTLLFGRGKSDDQNCIKISNDLDVYFSAFSMRFFGESKNLYFDKRIEGLVSNSDIIHMHNLHGYYVNYERLIDLIVKHDKPLVWTFHDMWPITGRCASVYECEKWMSGCGNCKYKYIYPKTYLDKSRYEWKRKNNIFNRLNKNKTILVPPSEWLANMIRKSYMRNYDIEVIPNGVKGIEIKKNKNELRKELNLPIDKKIILFVAADLNDERKGIRYILEILNDFNQDILFLSMGENMKNVKSDILVQMGYISDNELLHKIYKCCDLYVNPTLGETFSLTTAEALSDGIPIIAFNTGPLPELVNECGILVEKGNSQELKNAINNLIYDDDMLSKYASNALKKFQDNFSFEKFTGRYLNLYERLLK